MSSILKIMNEVFCLVCVCGILSMKPSVVLHLLHTSGWVSHVSRAQEPHMATNYPLEPKIHWPVYLLCWHLPFTSILLLCLTGEKAFRLQSYGNWKIFTVVPVTYRTRQVIALSITLFLPFSAEQQLVESKQWVEGKLHDFINANVNPLPPKSNYSNEKYHHTLPNGESFCNVFYTVFLNTHGTFYSSLANWYKPSCTVELSRWRKLHVRLVPSVWMLRPML